MQKDIYKTDRFKCHSDIWEMHKYMLEHNNRFIGGLNEK